MESTYKVIELVGTSPNFWEEVAKNAIDTAAKSLEDIRIAEAVECVCCQRIWTTAID